MTGGKTLGKMAFDKEIECVEALGYTEVKKEQKEAVVVDKEDVFVCLPTGYGKSLCYYCIPVLFDKIQKRSVPWSLIIIVSPLVALMKDQVFSLNKRGLKVIAVTADSTDDITCVMKGKYQYILTTPEILLCSKNWSGVFCSTSFQERLVGVIIDEAHCVKKW